MLPSAHSPLSRFLFRNALEAEQSVQRDAPSAVTATLSELGSHILEPSSSNRVVIILLKLLRLVNETRETVRDVVDTSCIKRSYQESRYYLAKDVPISENTKKESCR